MRPGAPRGLGRDDRSGNRPDAPVERELPERRVLAQPPDGNLLRRGQHRQRDRQVEARAFLAHVRGREVDRDAPQGPFELGARDPAADPLLRLLAGAVGQSDDRERRDAPLEMGLDLDRPGLEADQRMSGGAREHPSRLGGRTGLFARLLCQKGVRTARVRFAGRAPRPPLAPPRSRPARDVTASHASAARFTRLAFSSVTISLGSPKPSPDFAFTSQTTTRFPRRTTRSSSFPPAHAFAARIR